MVGKRTVWGINPENLGTNRELTQKVARPVADRARISVSGERPTFTVMRISDAPASFLVSHEETGNEWTVIEGADKKLDIVSGQVNGLPQVRGLTPRAVIGAAKKALRQE